MRIEVRAGIGRLGDGQRTHVERAAALALGRFAPRIPLVCVTVADAADAGDAAPERRVSVRLDGPWRLLVLERDPSLETALRRALDRARRYLERETARRLWRRAPHGSDRVAPPLPTRPSHHDRGLAATGDDTR
jgi:hypothetical protein